MESSQRSSLLGVVVLVLVIGIGLVVGVAGFGGADDPTPPSAADTTTTTTAAGDDTSAASEATVAGETTTTTLPVIDPTDTAEPAPGVGEVGGPWGSVTGLLMFRGNPTRTWYGTGPMPATTPDRVWRYPSSGMCSQSTNLGSTTTWCGTGWTGQPAVWERPDGVTEVVFGAYDRAVHFVDAATGTATRERLVTGDIIKGSVSIDPDGFPLLYTGSRDNKTRIVALDREPVETLWSIDANDYPGIWNDDWDSNPVIIDDVMYQGAENGKWFAIELNRGYDADGNVTVDPRVLHVITSYNDELLARVGDNIASVENSTLIVGDTAFFANSAGRIMGVDISNIREEAPLVFDWWAGDDHDATLVGDAEGFIYASVELERFNSRAEEVGQLIKLDPSRPDDPFVWGVPIPPRYAGSDGGMWATPALGDGVIYAPTHPGELLAVDTDTGEVVWRDEVGFHAWASPVIVDDALLLPVNCENGGGLRQYDISDPRRPVRMWQ
ncbi:MAG: PQQ-binding-like beta-propeller repeat protein, partial [Acidimicrobiia bacterium]